MRTTLVLSDAAYEVVRSMAFSEHRTMGEIVTDLILKPRLTSEKLSGPNELGFFTFATQGPLTVDIAKALSEDE